MGTILDHAATQNIGCYVGRGWEPLLSDLNAELEAIDPNYTWVQIKQKFCSLTVYLGSHDKAKCGCTTYSDCRMIQAIARYSAKSELLCEECGSVTNNNTGIGVTRCDECDLQEKAARAISRDKRFITIPAPRPE